MLARLTDGAPDVTIRRVERQAVSVLVVDDLASYRLAMASVIGVVDGFAVAGEVGSGEEALAFLERQTVGLVLMDVNMPGMGGIRAAEEIRSRHPNVPVILLSIYHVAELPAAVASSGVRFCRKDRFGRDELRELWDGRGRDEPVREGEAE
jgi:two-component system invasion response regulator UvrY